MIDRTIEPTPLPEVRLHACPVCGGRMVAASPVCGGRMVAATADRHRECDQTTYHVKASCTSCGAAVYVVGSNPALWSAAMRAQGFTP